MLMTDVTDDWQLEYNIGYLIIFLEVLIIGANLAFIFFKAGAIVYKKLRSLRKKKEKV